MMVPSGEIAPVLKPAWVRRALPLPPTLGTRLSDPSFWTQGALPQKARGFGEKTFFFVSQHKVRLGRYNFCSETIAFRGGS